MGTKKFTKKELFELWVLETYPNKIKDVKIEVKFKYAFRLYQKDIDLSKYKTTSKKAILWEHFIKLINGKLLDVSHLQEKKPPTPPNFEKQRKKIIRKAKGIINPESFYLSDNWLLLKRKVHRLYKCGCMKCLKEGVETHIDHILPRSKYPALSLDIHNLQILCKDCNMEKSNKHNTDYRTDEQRKLCSLKHP